MKSKKYLELKEKIEGAISRHDAYSYEDDIDDALYNFEINEEEANELYDIMEDMAQYYEDLYTTTPRKIGDEDPQKYCIKTFVYGRNREFTMDEDLTLEEAKKAFREEVLRQSQFNKNTSFPAEVIVYLREMGTDKDIKIATIKKNGSIHDSHVINDIIKETSEGYVIYSHAGKRLSKAYKNKEDAEKRLKEIEMFKHMNDSYYNGYGIEKKEDVWQVWKYHTDGRPDERKGGDFVTEEEAREYIDGLGRSQPKETMKKFEVEFIRNDEEPMTEIVIARTRESAVKQVKANYKGEKISEIRVRELKKEMRDDMDEVKEWLKQYIVQKDDPDNKLGKTYLRNLKNEEALPKGVYLKAGTDRSGIVHFKRMDFYWYLDGEDELHVEKYIRDAKGGRFICESYFDEKLRGLEDREQVNTVEEIQDWILDKANKGYFARAIDRATGEVWVFNPDELVEDPFELDNIQPSNDDSIDLYIVEWYNPKGIKFRGEFDSKEDAEEFIKENTDDNHINIQMKEETRSMIDSVKFNKEKVEAELRKILTDYLLKVGYDKDDIDEWLVIESKPFTNDYGDKGINVEIRNEFVGYYDLPDEIMQKLDAVVDPAYFEPYYDTVWDAYIFDRNLEDSLSTAYIYQFPSDLTSEDLKEMEKYNLEILGTVEVEGVGEMLEDWLVRGTLEDLNRYCDEYLAYEMHPAYLWKEEDCPYE